MTDPTDKELEAFAIEEEFLLFCDVDEFTQIARAVLARWGRPEVAVEQVDRADAVNLARNTLTQHDRAITKKGVRVLAEAVLSMDAAISAARKQGANHD